MQNTLREKYKVDKSNIDEAYGYALALKYNIEYEQRVDDTFLSFANLFKEMYPNVRIEPPRGREKSKKSIKNKIEKLEIERLCKLYAIGEITIEELQQLYKLTIEGTKKVKKGILKNLFIGDIEDLSNLDKIVESEDIEEHIKTAILRIVNTRLLKQNKQDLKQELNIKYGEGAVKRTNQLKDNLLRWECIENLNEETKEKLHKPHEYLKVKDVRAFKFVIADVPDDIQTDNEILKELIEKRKRATDLEKSEVNDLCCIELSKDFVKKIIENEELLEKLNLELLPDSYKHKQKQNGYIAEHVKFCYKDNPEYTFEMQLRSIYREDISRANGKAAHDKRSGKKRKFPSTENKANFIEELKKVLPQYRILKSRNSEFWLDKCSMVENMLEYYMGYIKLDSKSYKKALEYLQDEKQTIK